MAVRSRAERARGFSASSASDLKGPRRGIGFHASMPAQHLAADGRQLARPAERPRGDDRLGEAAGARLVAIGPDHPRDLFFLGGIEEVGGARPVLAHAHVERSVLPKGEAALVLIELHGRNPDVERDAVHGRRAHFLQRLGHGGKAFVDEGQAPSALERVRDE